MPDAIVTIGEIPIAGGDIGGRILAGAGFLAFSALVPGGFLGISASTFGMMGAGLVLGGIHEWLSPKSKNKTSAIASVQNNQTEGKPIPIVYGRSWVTPTTISSGATITSDNTIESDGGGWFGIGAAYWTQYRSTAKMFWVDALCEGQINGLAGNQPEQGIWLNGVPLKNSDGSFNFQGVTAYTWRVGYNQPELPAPWDKVEREVEVGREIKVSSGAVIRRIDEANLDKIRIRLYWQQLSDNNGQSSTKSKWRVYIKEGNGSWVLREENELDGKSGSYEHQSTFTVGQASYYEVKIERNQPDPDPSDTDQLNTAVWRSYTLVWDVKMRYKYTALVAIEVDVEKFGTSQIDRRYLVEGNELVQIPTNATVRSDGSLSYSGTWDGNFQYAWTSCPCWCLFDLLKNNRFGLRVPSNLLDKFAFYAGSVYCNELIEDGFGTTEPRFSLNCTISTREEAFDLIRKICSVFNAMAYYAPGGSFLPVLDRPQLPTHQFTNSNGTFSYSSTPLRNRHNRISVSYQSLSVPDTYEREIWEYESSISKYGANELRQEGFGITSRGQANRAANWLGYTNQLQTETITIQTGMEGANIRPGQVVLVSDWLKTESRMAGRIAAATLESITLDQPIELPLGNHTLYVSLPDGTIAQRTIGSLEETRQTWDIEPNFVTTPSPQATWIISSPNNAPSQWRVVSVVETELHKYEIVGVYHDPDKYDLVEVLDFIPPSLPTSPPSPPLPPSNLTATQSSDDIIVSWSPPNPDTYTISYEIEWQDSVNPPQSATSTPASYLVTNVATDSYTIRVRAVDTTGSKSGWISTTIQINAEWVWDSIPYTVIKNEFGFAAAIESLLFLPDRDIDTGFIPAIDTLLEDPIAPSLGTIFTIDAQIFAPTQNQDLGFIPAIDTVLNDAVNNELTTIFSIDTTLQVTTNYDWTWETITYQPPPTYDWTWETIIYTAP